MKLPPEIDRTRLNEAIQHGRESLSRFRSNRVRMVREAAGDFWSENGAKKEVPVNYVAMYEQVVSRALVSKNPRVMLTTPDVQARPVVSAMETWANDEIQRMQLALTFQKIITDGLYSLGLAKVGLATPGEAAERGWRLRAGQPFIKRVDLDDFVYDVYAKEFNEVAFMGHKCRYPLSVANRLYRKGKEALTETEASDYDESGEERLEALGRRNTYPKGELEKSVDLWEVYLPRHGIVVCLVADGQGYPSASEEPLYVKDWIGPPEGPYVPLGFGWVSQSAMPKGPIQNIMSLHYGANRSYRKLMRQADRLKQVLPYKGTQAEDVQRMGQSADGEMFQCDNPDLIKEIVTGGPVPALFVWAKHVAETCDKMAGNLSMLAGLAPQSKTAAQDKMLNENSSRMAGDMQETSTTFVAECLRRLCWYWWYHPQKVMKSSYTPGDLPEEFAIQRKLYPAGPPRPDRELRRNGPIPRLRVDPYSLVHTTPQQRLAFLDNLVTTLTPLMPLLQQNGIMFDAQAWLEMKAKYADEPDVLQIFKVQPAPTNAGGEEGAGDGERNTLPSMPPNTTRTYERRSTGADSQQAEGQSETAEMMGAAADAQMSNQ